jgi:hypothetical protein
MWHVDPAVRRTLSNRINSFPQILGWFLAELARIILKFRAEVKIFENMRKKHFRDIPVYISAIFPQVSAIIKMHLIEQH